MKKMKFKNVKHSVIMNLISCDEKGNCVLEHSQYKGLFYEAKVDELEEVEDDNLL